MKRLLLPLLAALALPNVFNADSLTTQKGYAAFISWWLNIKFKFTGANKNKVKKNLFKSF